MAQSLPAQDKAMRSNRTMAGGNDIWEIVASVNEMIRRDLELHDGKSISERVERTNNRAKRQS